MPGAFTWAAHGYWPPVRLVQSAGNPHLVYLELADIKRKLYDDTGASVQRTVKISARVGTGMSNESGKSKERLPHPKICIDS